MPLRLDIKKKLHTRTERVKAVDFHPTEPWVLSALYNGHVMVHDWTTQSPVKSIEVSTLPVRAAKFVARKQWIVTGGDDMAVRVYSYNTLEKVKEFEAHCDYIRYIAVHPTQPYILTASDDTTCKLWDWDRDWARLQSFEGHAHYVMMCQWNPKDPHIFATASLDRTIKVWGIPAPGTNAGGAVTVPHFNLLGHEKGVNCIEYSSGGEKPYIVSGSDDCTVRVWDYQTKQCVTCLTGHTRNVSAAVFHPHLPIILSGAEDGTVRIWHSATYRLETTLNYMMERLWTVGVTKGKNVVALGYDEGTMVIKLGSEAPIASMQAGKIVWARGSDIQTANFRLVDDSSYGDGERLPLAVKDLGACEIFPQSVAHHPNGRFVAVCGDGEYVIYTSQALRNKAYGRAADFVWSPEGHYAVRDETKVSVFKNFVEHTSFKPSFAVEELFGGHLIGLRSREFICFYDWQETRLVRRIDVAPRFVWWNDSADLVCLAAAESFYVLRHDKQAVAAAIAGGAADDDEGIEIAFEFLQEINEKIETATWVSECLVYVTSSGLRLQTWTAGQIDTVAFLDRWMLLLGYMAENNRLYLIDRDLSVVTYVLQLALVEYQAAVCRRDFETASQHLPEIPEHLHDKVARFLEHQGYKEVALEVTKDLDHRFDLALSLGKLQLCAEVIKAADEAVPGTQSEAAGVNVQRWKQLGDAALEHGSIVLAAAAFEEAKDFTGLLLIRLALGDVVGLRRLAASAQESRKSNVSMVAHLLLGEVDKCVEVLVEAGRYPEAALFARTYCPSQVERTAALWKEDLKRVNEAKAKGLALPSEHPELFPDFELALRGEEVLRASRQGPPRPASDYTQLRELLNLDVIEELERVGSDELQQMFREGIEVIPESDLQDDAEDRGGLLDGAESPDERGIVGEEEEEEELRSAEEGPDVPGEVVNGAGEAHHEEDFLDLM